MHYQRDYRSSSAFHSMREATQRDADRERRLRADSESKTKQALQEAARCRSRLKLLTSEFSRMEETVRSMLVYKKQAELLKQEKTSLTIAFENRCQQYQNTIQRLNQEIFALRQQVENATNFKSDSAQALLLQKHVDESRRQYERCLDDVANQVVRALVTQKGLKEEVCSLNARIIDLEAQNSTLGAMLVQQFASTHAETIPMMDNEEQTQSRLGLEPLSLSSLVSRQEEDNTSADVSPLMKSKSSVSLKHCNSFNSEILDVNLTNNTTTSPNVTITPEFNDCDKLCRLQKIERHLSAGSELLDSRLSLEDKKRHQVLTKLWTELKGSEVTPKRLIEALSAVDSALWVPPQRPVSLNLQLPILQSGKYRRTRPVLVQTVSKSEETEETVETGNESPESGNRDEGYSTMSSDVQAEVSRGNGDTVTRTTVPLEELKEATDETDNNGEPDVFYIPINLLNLKPRNSFPPGKDFLPFQHIMRSFSDSHLCIKITTAPSPSCYTFSSPISSSPSILVVDITDRNLNRNPLRRAKATSTLAAPSAGSEETKSPQSWSSSVDDRVECSTFDADYIQHWLRLDDTRSTLQQQHRDLFELEYDKTELEDWSLSLSNEDLREQQWQVKHGTAVTPGQYSLSTLPSIQENNALELEEDASECLWNSSSYMVDHEGHEIVTLLMDASPECQKWPYAVNYQLNVNTSPDNSWSSGGSDCYQPETCSKRSSAALSGCSDDTGELPLIGTDFTRDFYRLVKFESTKSLASTSSRSVGGALSENGEREAALQNVLTFIAEQQKYAQNRESPTSTDLTKEFNIEAPAQMLDETKVSPISSTQSSIPPEPSNTCLNPPDELLNAEETNEGNYVTLKQLSELKIGRVLEEKITYAEEVCLVTPLEGESENCSHINAVPVDICASEVTTVEEVKSLNESFTSSVSTPDTIVSKIPLRRKSKIPVSPAKTAQSVAKLTKSKIPHRTGSRNGSPSHVANTSTNNVSTNSNASIIDGPPHRAMSFHERATSKDVIDELNRMIRNGDENSQDSQESLDVVRNLDEGCMPTGWVHVERNVDLNDPKARASLLDVMMASVSSDSSPSSSCGGSVSSESMEEQLDYGQLHKIHRYHRQKKAHATRPELAVVRASAPLYRPSIIGRPDFFVRYGDKEKEAVASFDFLDDICTSGNVSECNVDE
ncbi:uncharacterized protein [Atheta coriaria]|uniref:uncharacterized protein isoform X3 n=1 Tax=Dalotia coriaria TaxID=877792 RepID=UPI0031F4496E